MTFDETPRCQCDQDLVCAECECSFEMLARGPFEERCILKHTTAESTEEKEVKGKAGCFNCRRCMVGCVDERNNWIASYVRTRLRTMAGDDFPISRHTADFTAHAVQDRFLSDTDTVLKRILELAALRYLRDGSSTVTQEDVAVALRSLAHPHR
ncbi:hypothetical protein [Paraburkholderia oxyphila]|uniref:hypothetical protein n=1 Tax=Paraburkholderia oxyphila TaxID=614212 RepID=UPI0012ED85DF|nr:hypothetical protein [Paraburkholderia oxyphila]